MPIHIFWGDDLFLISHHLTKLKRQILDPGWEAFNFHEYQPTPEIIEQLLTEIMIPPVGNGSRLAISYQSPLLTKISDLQLQQLQSLVPSIPSTNTVVLTSKQKPDGRLKSVKFLTQYAQVQEFSLIPPWHTQALVARVQEAAHFLAIPLNREAATTLATAVGNNTRLMWGELKKLATYANGQTIDTAMVRELTSNYAATSLDLANAIKNQDVNQSVQLLQELTSRNEPLLKIVATLISQFRTWLWVKALVSQGVTDSIAISVELGLGNPKRVYYLRREVEFLSLERLKQIMGQLLQLELDLKSVYSSTIPMWRRESFMLLFYR